MPAAVTIYIAAMSDTYKAERRGQGAADANRSKSTPCALTEPANFFG
jgi:hypothetical protein